VPQSIQDFIDAIGMVDVHEHDLPEVLLRREVNLLQLFRLSYAGWVERRGYAFPGAEIFSEWPSSIATFGWT
jgi:hypothetical protein